MGREGKVSILLANSFDQDCLRKEFLDNYWSQSRLGSLNLIRDSVIHCIVMQRNKNDSFPGTCERMEKKFSS